MTLQPITWHLFQEGYFIHDQLSIRLEDIGKSFQGVDEQISDIDS